MYQDGGSKMNQDGAGKSHQDGASKQNHATLENPPSKKSQFFTTLVIDGQISFAEFLQEFFKTEGHLLLRAETAVEALDMTREYQPDLILLDSELEGILGLALLCQVLMEQASAAVVVMARTPNVQEAVEAMKLGAVDYLERPLDLVKLKKVIDTQKSLFKI
jgi:DNA-binding NtrC family response regulator